MYYHLKRCRESLQQNPNPFMACLLFQLKTQEHTRTILNQQSIIYFGFFKPPANGISNGDSLPWSLWRGLPWEKSSSDKSKNQILGR